MNRKQLEPFLNKPVKLTLPSGFTLYGKITEIFDDCIRFETPQKASLLRFERIAELSEGR